MELIILTDLGNMGVSGIRKSTSPDFCEDFSQNLDLTDRADKKKALYEFHTKPDLVFLMSKMHLILLNYVWIKLK